MIEKTKCIVVTFHTMADSLNAEKICKKNDYNARLIPVPREITAGCGTALRVDYKDSEKALVAIKKIIEIENTYELFLY